MKYLKFIILLIFAIMFFSYNEEDDLAIDSSLNESKINVVTFRANSPTGRFINHGKILSW